MNKKSFIIFRNLFSFVTRHRTDDKLQGDKITVRSLNPANLLFVEMGFLF